MKYQIVKLTISINQTTRLFSPNLLTSDPLNHRRFTLPDADAQGR